MHLFPFNLLFKLCDCCNRTINYNFYAYTASWKKFSCVSPNPLNSSKCHITKRFTNLPRHINLKRINSKIHLRAQIHALHVTLRMHCDANVDLHPHLYKTLKQHFPLYFSTASDARILYCSKVGCVQCKATNAFALRKCNLFMCT